MSYRTAVGSGPKTVLNLATVNTGSTGLPNHDFGIMHTSIALQVVLGGTVPATGGVITVYGSLDGVNYDPTPLATWTVGTQVSGNIVVATGKGFIYVNCQLASLAGGTSPTVNAVVAAY